MFHTVDFTVRMTSLPRFPTTADYWRHFPKCLLPPIFMPSPLIFIRLKGLIWLSRYYNSFCARVLHYYNHGSAFWFKMTCHPAAEFHYIPLFLHTWNILNYVGVIRSPSWRNWHILFAAFLLLVATGFPVSYSFLFSSLLFPHARVSMYGENRLCHINLPQTLYWALFINGPTTYILWDL